MSILFMIIILGNETRKSGISLYIKLCITVDQVSFLQIKTALYHMKKRFMHEKFFILLNLLRHNIFFYFVYIFLILFALFYAYTNLKKKKILLNYRFCMIFICKMKKKIFINPQQLILLFLFQQIQNTALSNYFVMILNLNDFSLTTSLAVDQKQCFYL